MGGLVRWSAQAAEHMLSGHGVPTAEANEVLEDDDAIIDDPDPSSVSGEKVRIIGWSYTRRQVITVILLHDGDDWIGINGWPTKSGRDRTRYGKGRS